ncbi:MAG: addiction module toxin RelE [Alphaproteobacteria bacterium]|nr:addiction module toxin RelE [Alphaproteobacteria bacterium]
MITIGETLQFIKKAEKLMTKAEKDELVEFVAKNPEAGDIIPKTGGVRKLRFAREGQGKSSSFRVIYYYYNVQNPVYMLTVFEKNEKANISDAEKQTIYKAIQVLKKEMKS